MSDKKQETAAETSANAGNMFTKPLVLKFEYQGKLVRNQPYGIHGQCMDIYYPVDLALPVAAVILVTRYPDPGFKKMTGMQLKDIGQNQSWGKLRAAAGFAVILYTASDPVLDALELVDWITVNAVAMGIDPRRLGVLSLSGNVPNALHVLQERQQIRGAALCYGFMLDCETNKGVSAAAAQYGFVNPNATDVQLSPELALLVLRAGQDAFPGLNASIDDFVLNALQSNRDLELINFPAGVHAFDIQDDSARSQQLLGQVVSFLQRRLTAN